MSTQRFEDLFINHINNLTTALMMTDNQFAMMTDKEHRKVEQWASYAQADAYFYAAKLGTSLAAKLLHLAGLVDDKLMLKINNG